MLLGAAKILLACREEMAGEVRLFFQAVGEANEGADYYVEQGVLEGVDAVLGMRVTNQIDAPKISVESGERMSACDSFRIEVEGVSAHGSAPHKSRDAVLAASEIVLNLQTFVSRSKNPFDPVVLTVGTMNGGTALNIISGRAELKGTVRMYSREFRETMKASMERIVKNTAEAMGCTARLTFPSGHGPVVNDNEELNRIAFYDAVKLFGEKGLDLLPRQTASENFAALTSRTPGFLVMIGGRNPDVEGVCPEYSAHFQVDERTFASGAAFFTQFALDYLAEADEGKKKEEETEEFSGVREGRTI